MSHYMDFDPYLIRERNEQIRNEVKSLRLEEASEEETQPARVANSRLG